MGARVVPLPFVHHVSKQERLAFCRAASAAVRVMRTEPGWDSLSMLAATLDVGGRLARERKVA